MKYLLLDTNIYLNIIVNRRKDINNKLIATFSKLLQYGEVKLIVPSIVKYETFKHLESEVEKIGTSLDMCINFIDSIYWVNGLVNDDFDIKISKKNSKEQLQNALDYFNKNKGVYIEKLHALINSIFENDNSILINDNEKLLNGALQRKIYKKAPCHYENKESYGDALITENLINLRDLIEIKEDDCIYFISDNTEDFSSKHLGKKYLHEHITKDLIKNELKDMVNYRINFSKFIIEDLKEEIVNANLKEEFEKELEEEQDAEEVMYYSEHEDMLRESYGLPSLTSFDDRLRDKVSESHEVEILLGLFESINKIYSELEELYYFYWDEFSTMISSYDNNEDSSEIDNNVIISKFNKFLLSNKEKFYCYSIKDILEWISLIEDEIYFEFDKLNLEDYISLDESIIIMNAKKRELLLIWENVELYPESGEMHTVYCYFKELKNKAIISEGRVEINYGYAEEDEYGQVGDGCEARIDIYINSVIESIEKVKQELEELKAKHEKYIDYIKSEYEI